MAKKRVFTISEDDWGELKRLSQEARKTPVMRVGSVDLSASARDRVMRKWEDVGRRMGFVPSTVEQHDESERQVKAEPVSTRDRDDEIDCHVVEATQEGSDDEGEWMWAVMISTGPGVPYDLQALHESEAGAIQLAESQRENVGGDWRILWTGGDYEPHYWIRDDGWLQRVSRVPVGRVRGPVDPPAARQAIIDAPEWG